MEYYGVNKLRKMFLDFFDNKEHMVINSYPLLPHNDKSLLLVNAGMAPLKPYFTGQETPPKNRMASCQKCIRTGDIENVGITSRHGTFFEMLGNFSFGDYFKKEAISWSWEFLTEIVGLDKDKLYPSVYEEDDEAFDIWEKEIGIPAEKIFKLGKEDNFWEIGSGPCGPCSEIYYDRGEKYACDNPDCTVGCCDRYIELWNNVFTQFDGDGNGNYTELDTKNIDTGMGLERLAMVVQEVESIFDIDTMKAIRDKVCHIADISYTKDSKQAISIRLITDHIRAVTFMASDGIIPSNEGRGYVFRRLLRRAARHGRLLGIKDSFLDKISKTVIEESKEGYPELKDKEEYILKLISIEEENFNKTIDQGLSMLADIQEGMKEKGLDLLSGEQAFKLYDTYGFPLDLTMEILAEKGLEVDEDGFNKAMEIQRATARKARNASNFMGNEDSLYLHIDANLKSEFVGYDSLCHDSEIVAITTRVEETKELKEGEKGTIIVLETPFYPSSGGQDADTGLIKTEDALFEVEDTVEIAGSKIAHIGTVKKGTFNLSNKVTLEVNGSKRSDTAKNHSATHLLQKALRQVLGAHVEQAGSYVSEDRLRFDFTHFTGLSQEEINKVEALVNEQIHNNLPVITKLMNIEEAKKEGAMALFGETYDSDVRVVSMGDFSKELCGGTHVTNTGSISNFKILSETGIAAGVRRIEALTGNGLLAYYKEIEKELYELVKLAKVEPGQLTNKVENYIDEIKTLRSENERLKSKLANSSIGDVLDQVEEVKGVKLLSVKVPELDMNGLRNLGDQVKDKLDGGVIVLASSTAEDKVSLLAMMSDDVIRQGGHAGKLIQELASLVGGGGGGRPNMAQAGGKSAAGIDSAIGKAKEVLSKQLE